MVTLGVQYLLQQKGIDYESLNTLLKINAKYSSMHLGLLFGIHWGLAITSHDLQKDFINSSL